MARNLKLITYMFFVFFFSAVELTGKYCRGKKIDRKSLRIRLIDRSEQTVQTLIRLLQKEQSDQGLHCLPFNLF